MRRFKVLAKTLREMRWQVFWYALGTAAMAALVVYIYPDYREQFADFEIPEALKAFIGEADYTTPGGFLQAEFFSWVPMLLAVFAIMQGTNLLAGEEVDGTMDLLLSQPISRSHVLAEKFAGFAVATVAIVVLSCLGWLLSVPFVDIDIPLWLPVAATLSMLPLLLCFGALGAWSTMALGSRAAGTGLTTAVAVGGFFINYIAALVDSLEFLRWFSPFHYSTFIDVLDHSVDWLNAAVPGIALVLLLALVFAAFESRDIGVRTAGLRLLPLRRGAG